MTIINVHIIFKLAWFIFLYFTLFLSWLFPPFNFITYSDQNTKRMKLFKNTFPRKALIFFSYKCVHVHTQQGEEKEKKEGREKS